MSADPDDHRDAAAIASGAGDLLLDIRTRLAVEGVDIAELRGEGDRRANEYILDAISRRHPDDAVLSEEAADDSARLLSRRVWIIDPLDGTREFGEAGRRDWAVHVALVVDGTPAAGAVALPARGITLATNDPPRSTDAHLGSARIVVSRTRAPDLAVPLAQRLGATVVPMGSAGAKAMAIVLGEAEIFVHAGGQYEWDSAAPVAVAAAAGLHVSRIDGSPLRYNNANPWMPDLLICIPQLATATLEVLRDLIERPGVREPTVLESGR
ncbi:MAG: 3(2), 5-bisphosphate nucleotidase [Actinomycetota bacterium]|jgi:3'(2'), 5'-bisphosphate nucleotidase|nr:3(2), 5-bisphosphate nucleotidase [Actinomycetota bacterium]